MIMLVEIEDNKVANFKELIEQHFHAKAKAVSSPNAAILEEILHIKKAFKNLEKVKAGKLKTRPASELLDEL